MHAKATRVRARTAARALVPHGVAWSTGRRPQPEHRIAAARVVTHVFPPQTPACGCEPIAAHRSDHAAERAHQSRARSNPTTTTPTNESVLAARDAEAARTALAATDPLPGELGASVLRARLGVRRHARRVRHLAAWRLPDERDVERGARTMQPVRRAAVHARRAAGEQRRRMRVGRKACVGVGGVRTRLGK